MSRAPSAGAPVGDLLRQHRAAMGLSQEELAERAGISARAVSDIERGLRRTVYRHTVSRLARALRLDGAALAAFEAAARPTAGAVPGTPAAPRTIGLPPRLNRLIGRERELASVAGAIRSGGTRLLTLTGAGGMGKTRLAVEVAVVCAAGFRDGAVFVPLAATREPGLVVAVLSHALGVTQHSDSLLDGVIDHLRDRQVLLVLDNFEHLLEAAPLVTDLLAACPEVTVLATSRAALGLSGETEVLVPPLTSGVASEDLFIERARAVRQELAIDGHERAVVAEICHRLDGLPLAIELAARRVRHLGLEALREHLSRRLDLLSGGPRDLPERQQTMRNTIAWSHDLLSEPEQRMLRRLSVFAGGCTLDAAAHVCDMESVTAVLPVISALVDQSLLALAPSSGPAPRYRMLEVIREFAAEQAEARDDPRTLSRRHAEHFLAMAQEAQPHLVGRGQQEWYERLEADHDNMRVALRWALSSGDADTAMRLAGALWMFWRQHGDFVEGSRWLTDALALDSGSAQARLAALWGAAWLAFQRGDYDRMRAVAAEHLDLARATGDSIALRNALTEQGIVLMTDGRADQALACMSEALDIARGAGSTWIRAMSLFNFADCTVLSGDLDEGSRLLESALAQFSALGDDRFAARMLGRLALTALLQNGVARARALAAECLVMLRNTGEQWGLAEGLEIMAAAVHGEPVRAARLWGAAQALRDATGTEPMPFDARRIEPYLDRAEAALGQAQWDAAVAEGLSMSAEEAIACAVG